MRVMVAMSGGIDSTVTAALLAERGHDVVGLHMRIWYDGDPRDSCTSEVQLREAREVAERYGFPIHQIDFADDFRANIVDYFVAEYLSGRTPSPCVHCNRKVKFGLLLEQLEPLGCAMMATGHYTQVAEYPATGRRALLRRGTNGKDQTYFLNRLTQRQLERFLPVLGEMDKPQVRAAARRLKLAIADKPESKELCFLPNNDYRRFIAELGHTAGAVQPGEIVDTAGNVLGRHNGIANYTIGQRKGIGVSHEQPLYVVDLDLQRNRVIVGEREHTLADSLVAEDMNWVAIEPPAEPLRVTAQVRYRQQPLPAMLSPLDENRCEVVFDEPVSAITPGQALAVYDPSGAWLFGGGWIVKPG